MAAFGYALHRRFGSSNVIMVEAEKREDPFKELMRRSQAGDAAAYAELLREIATVLRRVVRRRRTRLTEADVEDLVQDVLLAVHTARATYDPTRPFMPWLMAITRNRFADRARRYFRQDVREVPIDEQEVTLELSVTNTMAEGFAESDALYRAIEALPSGQREAIEMLKLQEMSLKEASDASGVSVGALKVATHRAVNALRKILKKQ
jgi:RNA polymerase sigma-70 factor (ECF subfamily)